MKKYALLFILIGFIYSLSSCSANKGHGCGYWSATKVSSSNEKQRHFIFTEEIKCKEVELSD